jgi:hypothetical protein
VKPPAFPRRSRLEGRTGPAVRTGRVIRDRRGPAEYVPVSVARCFCWLFLIERAMDFVRSSLCARRPEGRVLFQQAAHRHRMDLARLFTGKQSGGDLIGS